MTWGAVWKDSLDQITILNAPNASNRSKTYPECADVGDNVMSQPFATVNANKYQTSTFARTVEDVAWVSRCRGALV